MGCTIMFYLSKFTKGNMFCDSLYIFKANWDFSLKTEMASMGENSFKSCLLLETFAKLKRTEFLPLSMSHSP